MADQPASEKTEQPSQRRIDKAREKGEVAQSQELGAALSILALVAVIWMAGDWMFEWFAGQVRSSAVTPNSIFENSKSFSWFFAGKLTGSLIIMMPVFLALSVGSVLSQVLVSGINFAPQALSLRFDAISPANGLNELFNVKALMKLGISIVKMIFIGVLVWFYVEGKLEELGRLRWAWSAEIVSGMTYLIMGMLIRVCVGLIVIASIDVIFQKWQYTKKMMMTKQEVKQEHKDIEGSPEIKGRIRRIQFEMARKRMMKEVPNADVILVNPTHVAVAIKYNVKEMEAPTVVAKGADNVAEKIREIARAYGVPVIRRPELARAIYSTVKPGQTIPPVLYTAVAEVLALIYRLKKRR